MKTKQFAATLPEIIGLILAYAEWVATTACCTFFGLWIHKDFPIFAVICYLVSAVFVYMAFELSKRTYSERTRISAGNYRIGFVLDFFLLLNILPSVLYADGRNWMHDVGIGYFMYTMLVWICIDTVRSILYFFILRRRVYEL